MVYFLVMARELSPSSGYFLTGGEIIDEIPIPQRIPQRDFLLDRDEVMASLVAYQDKMNKGELDDLLAPYKRIHAPALGWRFVLSLPTYKSGGDIRGHKDEQLHIDGRYMLRLGYQFSSYDDPIWIGGTSFIPASELQQNLIHDGKPHLAYSSNGIAVVQLQGVRAAGRANELAFRQAQKAIKLMPSLLAIIVHWADFADISQVYVLPGSMNEYYDGQKHFIITYDVTASRYRDQKGRRFYQDENGIYALDVKV